MWARTVDKVPAYRIRRIDFILKKKPKRTAMVKQKKRKILSSQEIDTWLAKNEGKHECRCRCGGKIKLLRIHKRMGVPKYLHGHVFIDPKAFKFKNIQKWVDDNQGKHFCKCGCGQAIKVRYQHRYERGIPEYVEKSHRKLHWIKEQQGKHFCQCGCGKIIKILSFHKVIGIPKFIRWHHSEVRKTRDAWVEQNQEKYVCACGCGQFITVHDGMKYRGITKFIHGHAKGLPLDIWVQREQDKHICKCGCGKQIPISREHRRHGIPKYILGHNALGENNPAWRGGITDDYRKRRNAHRLEDWRKQVLERDDYQCRMPSCQTPTERRLCAHHIVRFIDDESLATDLWNGITLCETCHYSIKGHERIYEAYFQDLLEFERLGIA